MYPFRKANSNQLYIQKFVFKGSIYTQIHPLNPYKLYQQQQMMIRAEKVDGVITPMTLLPTMSKRTMFMFPSLQPLMCSDAALTR